MVKKSVQIIHHTNHESEKLNSMLVENFVNLQKAITHLTGKFDDMSTQLSKLLNLFEISARSFAEKLSTSVPEIEKDKEFLDKLNKLLDQNKLIAKGIALMEEKVRERVYGQVNPKPQQAPMQPPNQRFSPQGYSPSLSQEEQ